MHPSVLIFDKIRTNKNFDLLEIWIGKHRIISGHLKPASYLHCQNSWALRGSPTWRQPLCCCQEGWGSGGRGGSRRRKRRTSRLRRRRKSRHLPVTQPRRWSRGRRWKNGRRRRRGSWYGQIVLGIQVGRHNGRADQEDQCFSPAAEPLAAFSARVCVINEIFSSGLSGNVEFSK